jgi:hypothetical protein
LSPSPFTPRTILRFAAILFALVVAMQVIPVTRDNPPVTSAIEAPAHIAAALRRSCFDCHSNETVWPWYSRVAPASWLVAHDVHEGREHLNFSTWASYSAADRKRIFTAMADVVERGTMPPGIYTFPLHPQARLTLEEISSIARWAREQAR